MGTVIVLQKPGMGQVEAADAPFASEMLDRFLHTLEPEPLRPSALCIYTRGVEAACQGSPCLLGLQLLQGLGVRILVCQTCLDYFGLRESLAVGEVVTMRDIVETLTQATRVLYP